MTKQAYQWYTDFGNDQRIAALSNQITQGLNGYWEKIQAIYERLKYGEYRYSLKPGLAPDGDQLGRFLFDAKKGYCSYFAFSMALLLRSQGIPARVAVGFFVDPDTKTFDYYPVRSDMAHAWVEVYFPRYGWIEYDPTTEKLAEGENFRFSKGVQPELFEKLLREILQNRTRLVPKEEVVAPQRGSLLPELAKQTLSFVKHHWKALILGCLLILFLFIRISLYLRALVAPKPRTRVILLDRHLRRRLFLSGYPQRRGESGGEYYERLEAELKLPLEALERAYSAARFAPSFTQADVKEAQEAYRIASARLRDLVPWYIRLLSWVLPVVPYLRDSRMFRVTLFIIACPLLFLARDSLGAQSPGSNADTIYTQAQKAQDAENWDRAIGLYQRGEASNPSDPRFPLSLGELYETRKLYNLAWEEYKKAESLLPEDPDVLYRLSNVAGRLNQNETSVQYLKRVLEKQGDNKDAIADLAWMDFKLHRLREGETLLLDALRRFGKDRGFSMTLGTIYSELFEYEKSKEQYREAIDDAQNAGAKIFVAVARYNLSILESRYYNYAEAFKQTTLSLAAADRTSGHLARGELYLKQLDFPKTFAEYQSAYSLDASPLSKINISQANQIAGRLAEGRAYAEEALSAGDLSWMINYGTDVKRHRRDIYDILKDTYEGLAMERNFVPLRSPQAWLKNFSLKLYYRFKATVNRLLYQKYSLQIAQEYRAQAQILDANINFYNALEDYPGRANSYLSEARSFEVARIPAARGTYDLEQGRLLHRRDLLERADRSLDPQWERDLLADTWTELALMLKRDGDRQGAGKYAERLYAINPGALRQRGLYLPVLWELRSPGPQVLPVSAEKALREAFSAVGFRLHTRDTVHPGAFAPRYRLSLTEEPTRLNVELYDSLRGISVVSKTFDLSLFNTEEISAVAEAWGNATFIRSGKP
jgi:tetratricopeptide (TPR) repeat protein